MLMILDTFYFTLGFSFGVDSVSTNDMYLRTSLYCVYTSQYISCILVTLRLVDRFFSFS